MPKIKEIRAMQILDSRGKPTIKTTVITESGIIGVASVPSGASTGIYEALELRDHEKKEGEDDKKEKERRKKERYDGYGVLKAVRNVNDVISPELIKKGYDVTNQAEIDKFMIDLDEKLYKLNPLRSTTGKSNKSCLGANAILSVSLACARAAAKYQNKSLYIYIAEQYESIYNKEDFEKLENSGHKGYNFEPRVLPCPMSNVINGGSHADNNVDMQEYMVAPYGAKSFNDAIHMVFKTFQRLKELLKRDGLSTGVGDEGGFAPNLQSNEEPLIYILEAIKNTEYEPGKDIFITMDPASSEFYDQKDHRIRKRYSLSDYDEYLTSEKMIKHYIELREKYPEIISIEDGLAQDDWAGWISMTEKMGDRSKKIGEKIQIVGDDLFVTNKERLQQGIEKKAANAILIKLNQIGTLTETLETIALARENRYNIVISHRSGETCDTFIADLAVGVNAGQIKTGSICRSERIAKYNRLLEIEAELGNKALFGNRDYLGF